VIWQNAVDRRVATDPSRLIPESAPKLQHQTRVGEWPMMMKYLSKFVLDILPSIAATVIGAYIVNHYIIAKPTPAAPAAVASTAAPRSPTPIPDVKSAPATADTTAPPVVRDVVQKPAPSKLASEKAAEKPANEKSAGAPTARQDANDLARAAIERLRGSNPVNQSVEAVTRPREVHRVSVAAAPAAEPVAQPASMTAMQPLPPAIAIATPAVRIDEKVDSDRLIPPADIPSASGMFGLAAGGASAATASHTTVADDVVAAAKSVFQAVLPR